VRRLDCLRYTHTLTLTSVWLAKIGGCKLWYLWFSFTYSFVLLLYMHSVLISRRCFWVTFMQFSNQQH
jgi:hypothetical protein